MELAPIIVFAFNRLEPLKNTIFSLQKNDEAKYSEIFIFVDGPRHNKIGDFEKVQKVIEYVRTIQGFKKVHYFFADQNKGLARSVIEGTTKVINVYGKVIVVEDDLFVSESFLKYMNNMLDHFKNDERIMQISGYGSKLSKLNNYKGDIYLNERAQSWTWATWKDRWETIDWNVSDFQKLRYNKKLQKDFCKRGSDLYGMLKGYMEKKNNSWYIRFNYSMYKQHRYSICPIRSLVRNDGFGNEATHCNAYNRYKVDFELKHNNDFIVPEHLIPNEYIMKEAVKYWSIRYRIYGKIRTILMKK